jgi:alpha-ketoglutarate-dependent taurine dioxygenase
VRPLSPTIGAEVEGVHLADAIDDETLADLRRALLDYKVLFFRDQDITTEQHLATSDYWPRRRVMERVTIVGDTPV